MRRRWTEDAIHKGQEIKGSVDFCSVLFCSVLFCPVLFCSVLFDGRLQANRLITMASVLCGCVLVMMWVALAMAQPPHSLAMRPFLRRSRGMEGHRRLRSDTQPLHTDTHTPVSKKQEQEFNGSTRGPPPPPPDYTIRTFSQTLDHFNMKTDMNGTTGQVMGTFQQRCVAFSSAVKSGENAFVLFPHTFAHTHTHTHTHALSLSL